MSKKKLFKEGYNPYNMDALRQQIADKLGWTLEETMQFSLPSLRNIVAPISPKLAHEISCAMQGPEYIFR